VIVVSDKTDFITNHGDIIRRSKALVTSFGFGMNLDKTFSDINYLDYVFIEHGVIFLKKGRVLNRYNTLVFNRMIVPTRLTYDIYKDDNRYQKECLILSGIPRWDYLKNNRNGHIFVFFTWRTTFQKDPKSAHFYIKYIESFVNKLAQSLDNRVEIDVAAHHELGKIGVESYHFENEHVHLVDTDNISSMIRESSMLITDYSSVAFDFMYQDKPVIFYKFDRDALYLNHTDLIACLEAMQEDEKLYNCLYSEQEIFDKVQDYVARNFELEDELKKKNSQIFWERNNDCCAKLAEALIKKRRVMKGDLTQLGE
jgi:CDP-glycerol glycerophosphotransferase (TagB/SpsB family)